MSSEHYRRVKRKSVHTDRGSAINNFHDDHDDLHRYIFDHNIIIIIILYCPCGSVE